MNKENDYVYREATESDFEAIADFLVRHNYGPKHLKCSSEDYLFWLKWKFLDNPDGEASIFIAEDSEGAVVGFRAYLPRRCMFPNGDIFMASHGVDALTDKNLRKKGIYSNLRHFGFTKLQHPRFSFPTKVTSSTRTRDGDRPIGRTNKWVFPAAVEQSIKNKPYGFIAPLAGFFAKCYTLLWLGNCPADLKLRPIKRFEKDIDENPGLIHCIRSAAYLNWRFIDNPWFDYETCEFVEGNECIGYCVYADTRLKAEIYEFVTSRRHRNCFRLLVEHCRKKGIANLRFRGVGLRLGKYGFIPRNEKLVSCNAASDLPKGTWLITLGDRDF